MSTYSNVYEAIGIFRKYLNVETSWFQAEHDILYGPCFEDLDGITSQDKQKLNDLGWHEDTSVHCWAIYC